MGWIRTSERFVNPYNFVRLDGCQRSKLEPVKDPLTGYIEYKMTTRAQVVIPNTSGENALPWAGDATEHTRSCDFFSYDDLSGGANRTNTYSFPVIPGSEIRGVLRSAYEAAFHGCMSQMT